MPTSPTGGTLALAIFNEASGWTLPEQHHARLAELAGEAWTVRAVSSRAQLIEALGDAAGLVGMPLTEEQIRSHLGRLRFIQLARSSGDANPAVETALEGGVRVASAGTPRAPQVAEHAMAMALALLRRLDLAMMRQREHTWSAEELASSVRTMAGATVGVLGAAPFVRAMTERATPFGARVRACVLGPLDTLPGGPELDAQPMEALHDVLTSSDVVVVGLPRVHHTMGLIGRKALNAMKNSALLIDVSKGGIVDHHALVEALRRGRVSGAALDVFASEPLPATSPFWTMPGVLMTPHISAAGEGYWDRLIEHAGENARRASAGEPLIDELTTALHAAL